MCFDSQGIHGTKNGDRIIVSMDEYAICLNKTEIRKDSAEEELTDTELNLYRKYIEKSYEVLVRIVSILFTQFSKYDRYNWSDG